MPGFGGRPFTGEGIVAAHLDFLARRVREGDHLVGHDYGGWLAAMVARRQRVASLTLISTALGPGWWPAKLGALPLAERVCYRAFGGRRWLRRGVAGSGGAGAAFVAMHERWLGEGMSERMLAIARGLPWAGGSLVADLRQLGIPIRCVWGERDDAFPPWMGRRLARSLGATFSTAPGGHYGMVGWGREWAGAISGV